MFELESACLNFILKTYPIVCFYLSSGYVSNAHFFFFKENTAKYEEENKHPQ